MGTPLIQIRNLEKEFFGTSGSKVTALSGINLDINKGDIYGIIGMSGAGKSTLVRCINFLEKPTGGTVIISGRYLSALNDRELRSAAYQRHRQEKELLSCWSL